MSVAELADRVGASPDPARVRTVLDRLAPQLDARRDSLDERALDALVAVIGASDSLGELLCADVAALGVVSDLDRPVALDPSSPESLARSHRLARLRIGALDLLGLADLSATVIALSDLAADAIGASLALAGADGLAVVGMGKLGARELNYVSDVDLVLVSGGDPVVDVRAARRFLEVAGACFRVDTNLRPGGRDGALVRSLEGYVTHWERWAQAWEFQALLKARPVAGPDELCEAFASAAHEALWSRPFGADDLREVRRMKRRTEEEMSSRGLTDREIKRAPGGIRDIEFSVQLLQLVHGRADPLVRSPATLDALGQLDAGGYVDPAEADTLRRAYVWFRGVEHRLQLVQERQTHEVPDDRDRRRRIARVLGYRGDAERGPTDHFDADLARHRLAVRRVHEGWYFRPLLDSFGRSGSSPHPMTETRFAAFGFRDSARARAAVDELSSGLTRSSRLMRQLLPLIFDWLSAGPDPDLGLLGLRRLASTERSAMELVTAFRDSAETARRLCDLVALSPLMIDLLVQNPDLVTRLDDPESLRTRARPALLESAWRAVGWRKAVDDQRASLRRWHRRHLVGVVARDVAGASDATQVGHDLTGLAEAVVETALTVLEPQVPVAVVGMGRVGGAELSYASDLDLVVVFDGRGSADAAEAERVAAGLVRLVRGRTPADRVLDVDTDLRPEGRQGPLARSLDSYTIYLERWAETWERQALLRARPIAGDEQVGRAFGSLVDHALWTRPPNAADVRTMRRMKARIESERIPRGRDPRWHLKLGPGALADVEWTVQLLQWEHGVRERSTLGALDRLRTAGVLEADDATVLETAHRFLEEVRNRAWLALGSGDVVPEQVRELTTLGRAMDTTGTELVERHRRVTRRCRRVVERRFYGRVDGSS